jgi:hypothetical protein
LAALHFPDLTQTEANDEQHRKDERTHLNDDQMQLIQLYDVGNPFGQCPFFSVRL